ncbi:MAG: type II secretion system F family protein [Conexivisphaera sp.]
MARALAERAYRLLEALYGFRVTDELLRSRGIGLSRREFLRRELLLCSTASLAAALASLAAAVYLGMPPYAAALLALLALLEAAALVAGIRGRALLSGAAAPARARGRPRASRFIEPGLLKSIFPEDRVRRIMGLADMRMPPGYFYDLSTKSALAAAGAGAAILALVALMEHYSPLAVAIWALVGLLAGTSVGAMSPYAYISYRASSRSSRIEQDLSTWAAAMMAYVSSGASFPEALKRSTSALRSGPLRRELESVIRDSEVLGSEPRSSLLALAQRSPSQLLRELIVGIIDAMDSGKDLQSYFRESLSYILNYRRNYLRKLVNDMSLAAELFVMLFVVTPLLLAIILAVMGSMSVGAQPYYGELLAVIAFGFVPLVGVGYLLLVDSIYPRWW